MDTPTTTPTTPLQALATKRAIAVSRLPADEYHASPQIGSSQLVQVLRSPAHYKHFLGSPDREQTDAMAYGTAGHCLLLEPHAFKERYVFAPRKLDMRLKVDKAELATLQENNPGKALISPDDAATLRLLAQQLAQSPRAASLLSMSGETEYSVFWTDDETGIGQKVRFDKLVQLGPVPTVLDVKVTNNASLDAFSLQVKKMEYHTRAAMYVEAAKQLTGAQHVDFEWVVIERETGFFACYRMPPSQAMEAHKRYRRALATIAYCQAHEEWPGYQNGIDFELLKHR
jgi:hypothetical protein